MMMTTRIDGGRLSSIWPTRDLEKGKFDEVKVCVGVKNKDCVTYRKEP